MDITEILKTAVEMEASDIFIIAGLPVSFKKNGQIIQYDNEIFMPHDSSSFISEM